MKHIKSIVVILLILNANVVLASGVCDGKKQAADGYCYIGQRLNVNKAKVGTSGSFQQRFWWANIDQSGHKYPSGVKGGPQVRYFASYQGKKDDLYCIDGNLNFMNDFTHARPLKTSSPTSYDTMMAKGYQQYMKKINSEMKKTSYANATYKYSQVMYTFARALTFKFGYNRTTYIPSAYPKVNNSSLYSKFYNEEQKYRTLASILASKNYSGTQNSRYGIKKNFKYGGETYNNNESMNLLESWYDYATSSSTKLDTFEIDVKMDAANVKEDKNGSNFTKTIPVEITGLKNWTKDGFSGNLAPYLKLNSITCNNPNANCTIAGGALKQDLLKLAKGNDKYTVNIVVKGNIDDFKNAKDLKIDLKFAKRHPLDPDSLAIIKPNGSQSNVFQRMLWLLPQNEFTKSASFSVPMPGFCEREQNKDGKDVYKVGGNVVSIKEYLDAGCCDISTVDLLSTVTDEEKEMYKTTCALDDFILLQNDCMNVKGESSTSFVKQKSIDEVLEVINTYDSQYIESIDKGTSKSSATDSLNYNYRNLVTRIDDLYMDSGKGGTLSRKNNYCNLYTSEDVEIFYPGTFETVSGRYFKMNDKPFIQNKIDAVFRTSITRWETDYNKAIEEKERAKKAWDDAIADVPVKKAAWDRAKAEVPRAKSRVDRAEDSYDSADRAYDRARDRLDRYDREDPGYASARRSYISARDRRSSARSSLTSARNAYNSAVSDERNAKDAHKRAVDLVPVRKIQYENAVREVERIEEYKRECETKSNIASNWEFKVDPKLTYFYEQKAYDPVTDKAQWITTSEELEPTFVVESNPNNSGNKNTRTNPKTNFTYDTTFDYKVSDEVKIEYAPKPKFSLVPSGRVVTDRLKYQDTSMLDLGHVFDVEITNWEGKYYTWFKSENVGHKFDQKSKDTANVQQLIENYIEDKIANGEFIVDGIENDDYNFDKHDFLSACVYENFEVLVRRQCDPCIDPDEPFIEEFKPEYFFRIISIDSVSPQERDTQTNWTDKKGAETKKIIENNGDKAYGDEFLEYSFTLTPEDIYDFKKESEEYLNLDKTVIDCEEGTGKECKSEFLNRLAEISNKNGNKRSEDLLNKTRKSGWKYYTSTGWMTGSINDVLGGDYPEPPANPYDKSSFTYWP